MDIEPIGVVHSPVSDPAEMPFEGVPALIEVCPRFADGLLGITGGSHIHVIGWLHRAGRGALQITQTRWGAGKPRGVFGLRSSHRPNPLSLTTCRLLRVEGTEIHVERLDLIDGTPIVDIKRYSPSWDCVFSARSSRDLRVPEDGDRRPVFDGMMVEAVNFHGERCVGVALGVRLLHHAMMQWGVAQKDPKMVVRMGDDGCIADALQGLTGATLGNGRMKVPGGRAFRLYNGVEKSLAYYRRDLPPDATVERVLEAEIEELFSVRGDEHSEGEGPHEGRLAKSAPPEEKRSMLLARIQEVAHEGRLACARAHRLAAELGVSVPDVGWAADASKIRITRCQLGCFK